MSNSQDALMTDAKVDAQAVVVVPPSPGYDYRCQRCGHQWRTHKPGAQSRWCPKCHSASWDKPRKDKDHVSMSAGGELVDIKVGSTKRRKRGSRVVRRKAVQTRNVEHTEHVQVQVQSTFLSTMTNALRIADAHVAQAYALEPPPGLRLPDPPRNVERTPENIIGRDRSGGNDK